MTSDDSRVVYKLLPADLWAEWQTSGRLGGSPVDRRDGFIHLSTAAQVQETAARHFAGVVDLVLVAVRAEGLDLRWELSRGGDSFPHCYGGLPIAAVAWAKPLPVGRDGRHEFPPSVGQRSVDH